MKFRELINLTNEELMVIIKDIFHADKIDNVKRSADGEVIILNAYKNDAMDTVICDKESIVAYDYRVSKEENFKWKQFLLAKGCDDRLIANPYL